MQGPGFDIEQFRGHTRQFTTDNVPTTIGELAFGPVIRFGKFAPCADLIGSGGCGINQVMGNPKKENHVTDKWISDRFPQFESAIRQLADQHRQLKDEPLHLAISYGPERDRQDIFLFEAIGGNVSRLCEDHELFETVFTSHSGFPMRTDQNLHLVLATPSELETALREGWPSAEEIGKAIEAGDFQVLHADEVGQRLLNSLRSGTRHPEEAARG